ncbi:MAG: SAM-dependent chlorinase/fluorinase [Acidobacteriota bacterium]|nr:SAM-dependent chlorinase/fluorinase [Acidobacteriota bacterium]
MKNPRAETATRGRGAKTPSPRRSTSPSLPGPLITLLTDFGTADYFVAAVKGVILGLNPHARLIDITHEIPPQDIETAAFTLLAACWSFPVGTIHIAVVDPGVGSSRRPVLIDLDGHFFVGPDNGIFSYVCDNRANLGLKPAIFHLTNTHHFRHPVSSTFNGRDVFAPVAAALSNGVQPQTLGTGITDIARLKPLRPFASQDGHLEGRVIHIDRFGNCVTNISQNELSSERISAGVSLTLNGKSVKSFRSYFAEETGIPDKLFGIWGSAGFLEIAASNESAAKILKAQRGDSLIVSAP